MKSETLQIAHEQIVATDFQDGAGVLVDLQTKHYFQLNETAMLVWRGLEKRQTLSQIADEICARYDVTPQHAMQSVEDVVVKFRACKLLQPT